MDQERTSALMRDAYEKGDHQTARKLASDLERALPDGDPKLSDARRILRETEPDPMIYLLVLLGLGLTVWLVYKYVL